MNIPNLKTPSKQLLNKLKNKEINELSVKNINFSGLDLSNKTLLSCNFEKCNFINIKFNGSTMDNVEFNNCTFSDVDFTASFLELSFFYDNSFIKTNFSFARIIDGNFLGGDIRNANFEKSILEGTSFRDCKYNENQFSEQQKITGDFSYKDLKNLSIENQKLKKITKRQEERIEEQVVKIDDIGDKRTNELLKGFEEIKNGFQEEERKWLVISSLTFLIAFGFGMIISSLAFYPQITKTLFYFYSTIVFQIIFIFIYFLTKERIDIINKHKKELTWLGLWINLKKIHEFLTPSKIYNFFINCIFISFGFYTLIFFTAGFFFINTKSKSSGIETIGVQPNIALIPLSILLFSFLYFSIFQYSKAKHLRIENQNRIALLSGFQALKADKNDEVIKSRFYDNIANVVFSKVYTRKNDHKNLPLDELIEAVKVIRGIDNSEKK